MPEIARWLFIAGAVPILVLGIAHAYATPTRKNQRKGISLRSAEVEGAMEETSLRLTPRTTAWLAWVGFNHTHSFGIVVFAVVVFIIGRSQATFAFNAPIFAPLAVVVSVIYSLIAMRYFFRTPIAGCIVSCLLFLASWLTLLA